MKTLFSALRLFGARWTRVFLPLGVAILLLAAAATLATHSALPGLFAVLFVSFLFAGLLTIRGGADPSLRQMLLDGEPVLRFSLLVLGVLTAITLVGAGSIAQVLGGATDGLARTADGGAPPFRLDTAGSIAMTATFGLVGWSWLAGAFYWRRRVRRTLGLPAPATRGTLRDVGGAVASVGRNLAALIGLTFAGIVISQAGLLLASMAASGLDAVAALGGVAGLGILVPGFSLLILPWLTLFLAIDRIDARAQDPAAKPQAKDPPARQPR